MQWEQTIEFVQKLHFSYLVLKFNFRRYFESSGKSEEDSILKLGDVRKPGFQLNSCPSSAKKGRNENISKKVNKPENN